MLEISPAGKRECGVLVVGRGGLAKLQRAWL